MFSESAVRFDGKSHLKYLHRMDEDNQEFKLSLRFKTFQEQGVLMTTNSTKDWGTLQVFISLGNRIYSEPWMSFLLCCTLFIHTCTASWIYLDITWRSCVRECKCANQLNWTLNRLYPASYLVQSLCNVWLSLCENSQRVVDVSIVRLTWNRKDTNIAGQRRAVIFTKMSSFFQKSWLWPLIKVIFHVI